MKKIILNTLLMLVTILASLPLIAGITYQANLSKMENPSHKKPTCQCRPYQYARLHEAKIHFSFLYKQLIMPDQIPEKISKKIWDEVTDYQSFHSSINGLVKEESISEEVGKKLLHSWNSSIGLALNHQPVVHNPITWSNADLNNKFEYRAMQAFIYEQTKSGCFHCYKIGNGKIHHIPLQTISKMQKGSFVVDSMLPLSQPGQYAVTDIKVIKSDTIEAACQLSKQGYKTVALNFANQTNVGGGVIRGAKAQEEDLFRRSTYFLGLNIKYNKYLKKLMHGNYSIPEFGAIYTPSVSIIRGSGKKGYAFIPSFEIDFIASAAYNIAFSFPFADESEYQNKTKEKIRTILRLSAATGHDAVVLGAFGCGAFKNPPDVMAQLFSQVLHESEFQGQFKTIVFAILNTDDNDILSIFQNNIASQPD